MKKYSLFPALLLAMAHSVIANPWTGNMKDALNRAVTDKKDVLIYFSGSSWDRRTQALEKDILSTDDFKSTAPKKFVLLNYDLPQNARQDPASQPKMKLAEQYGVNGIPSIILADHKGRAYAAVGQQKTTEEMMKVLNTLQSQGAEFRKRLVDAEGKKGLEKAEALVTALQLVPKWTWNKHYQAELDAIKAADQEGKTGFIAKIEREEKLKQEQVAYQKLFRAKKFEEVVKTSAKAISQAKGEEAQRLYMYQIQALAAQKKYAEAKAVIETMSKIDPKSQHGSSKERYLSIVDQMKVRDERQAQAIADAKKKQEKKPSAPIVSKPVAVVSDIKVLHEEVKQLEKQLAAATAASKKAADEQARLEKKLVAMKDVVKTHQNMEERKKKVVELEKQAKELEKQARDLKKKATEIKSGKK